MNASIGLRAAALAGVALLAAAIALAVSNRDGHRSALPPPAGQWYTALAAPYTPSKAKKGACGVVIRKDTLGVAHPVLPCGVKIYVQFEGKNVLTQVVDRGRVVPGHQFDVTTALAKVLGLHGTHPIRWRFAS